VPYQYSRNSSGLFIGSLCIHQRLCGTCVPATNQRLMC